METNQMRLFWLLVSYLLESHEDEIKDGHGGEGNQIGLDPECCTYCEAIRDAYEMHGYHDEWQQLREDFNGGMR